MKKLNALALAAALVPAMTLGIGTVTAEDRNPDGSDEHPVQTHEEHEASGQPGADASSDQDRRDDDQDGFAGRSDSDDQRPGMADDDDDSEWGDSGSDRGMTDDDDSEWSDSGMDQDMGGETHLSEKPSDGFEANDLIGEAVTNRNNDEDIGDVDDLVIDRDGQIVSVVVKTGGMLGMGKKDVAIDWDQIDFSVDEDGSDVKMTVDMDEESLKNAPEVEKSDGDHHASDLIGQTVTNRTNDEDLGNVDDLVIDRDGQIIAVVVGVGGTLGIGERDVAIAWDQIEFSDDGDGSDVKMTVDMDESSLESAPEYAAN